MAATSVLEHPLRIPLPDPAATCVLAGRIADLSRTGDVIGLGGPLGAGKTVFARAFINHIAARSDTDAEDVPSPTFTLVQSYEFPALTVHHFDLYRIARPEDAYELGIEDAFADGVSLIEWPERLGPLLPARRLEVVLLQGARQDARIAELDGGNDWPARLQGLAPDG